MILRGTIVLLILNFSADPWGFAQSAGKPVCRDTFQGTDEPVRFPTQILIVETPQRLPAQQEHLLDRLSDCPIHVYQDSECMLRYVTGQFWDPGNATPLLLLIRESGFPDAELFAFTYHNRRLVGWGRWVDFGGRIR